jgi:hypothetical protein
MSDMRSGECLGQKQFGPVWAMAPFKMADAKKKAANALRPTAQFSWQREETAKFPMRASVTLLAAMSAQRAQLFLIRP